MSYARGLNSTWDSLKNKETDRTLQADGRLNKWIVGMRCLKEERTEDTLKISYIQKI